MKRKKIVQFFSNINRNLGNPHILFSAFFLWGAIMQFGLYSKKMIPLFWFWLIFMLLNVPKLSEIISSLFSKRKDNASNKVIGKILGIQSKQIFLVKLFDIKLRPQLNRFDIVEFKYSFVENKIFRGFILDSYWLNEEQWVKVLSNNEIFENLKEIPYYENTIQNTVYKIEVDEKVEYIENFVGTITENSKIDKIRFIFASRKNIEAGQLLEVNIFDKKVFYQLLEGLTKIEQLEAKNESGNIIGEAIQLGVWNSELAKFDKFGWVPEINTPIQLISNTNELKVPEDYISVGRIPETNLPVLMNIDIAISHHMAILGVTGTGKSVFVRKLVREYAKTRKVFIVDFTGEHKQKFNKLSLSPFLNEEKESEIYRNIYSLNLEMSKFESQRNQEAIKNYKTNISKDIRTAMQNFLESDENIKIRLLTR